MLPSPFVKPSSLWPRRAATVAQTTHHIHHAQPCCCSKGRVCPNLFHCLSQFLGLCEFEFFSPLCPMHWVCPTLYESPNPNIDFFGSCRLMHVGASLARRWGWLWFQFIFRDFASFTIEWLLVGQNCTVGWNLTWQCNVWATVIACPDNFKNLDCNVGKEATKWNDLSRGLSRTKVPPGGLPSKFLLL